MNQRETAAIHEAAHAVVAYNFCWHVNHEGVEIDERQYTGLRCRTIQPELRDNPLLAGMNQYTEEARVCVSQAGWLAEVLWTGNADKPWVGPRKDENLRSEIDDLKWHDPESDEDSDDHDIFVTLKEHRPDATDDELLAAFREFEAKTIALLREPDIWAAVEALADLLCQKGKVMAEEVEEVLAGAGLRLFCEPEVRRQLRDGQ